MSPRTEAAAQTRDKLLDHALTLFSQRGYAATSVRDIIHAAGVTQPTLYYHFRDKTDLFQSLIQHHYAASQEQLEQIIDTVTGCEARLRTLVCRSFEFCIADPRVPRLMFQSYFGPPVAEIDGILDELTDQRFRLVTRIMQDGMRTGELKEAHAEFLALSFCCLMDQPINLFSRKPKPARYLTPELAESIVHLFLQGAG
jgi:TetR/AcrR family transcriptional regulator